MLACNPHVTLEVMRGHDRILDADEKNDPAVYRVRLGDREKASVRQSVFQDVFQFFYSLTVFHLHDCCQKAVVTRIPALFF